MNKKRINKKSMTLDEHRSMGKDLHDIRNKLMVNSIQLVRRHGETKELGLKLEEATKLIDEVRSRLDDNLFDEYPELTSKEGCKYYY